MNQTPNEKTDVRSLKYFLSQIVEFRNLMGLKSFWANDESCRRAKVALGHLYMSLQLTAAESETAQTVFVGTMDEFTRREFHVLEMVRTALESA